VVTGITISQTKALYPECGCQTMMSLILWVPRFLLFFYIYAAK